jgi:hypothetical protein
MRRAAGALFGLALVSWAGRAQGGEPAPDCSGPAEERPPDPRCGEALDGREPASTSGARQAGRAALFVPRAIAAGLLWPLVETSELVEAHHVQDWVDAWLTSDDGKVGARPLAAYATGFLPTVGARLFYNRLPVGASGSFQTAGPSVLAGDLVLAAPRGTGLVLHAIANHRIDRYFAGLGALSTEDLREMGKTSARFGSDIWGAELRWARRLPAHLALALHANVQRRDYEAEEVRGGSSIAEVFRVSSPACDATTAPLTACVDPTAAPGFQTGTRLVHAGAGAVWDPRSHARDGSGVSLLVDASFAQGIAGDPSRHIMYVAEPVAAVGFGDRQILLRGRAAMVDALGGAPIPFEELVVMSGQTALRGFPYGRFLGESGVVGTAEYRWYVAHWLDASLFSDVGTVAGHHFEGLAGAHWFPDFGVGLRLYRTPGNYWEGTLETGAQIVYAPDNGFRVIFAVASF